MSGIAGSFSLDQTPVQQVDIQVMVARLRRRGPDRSGIWVEGPVGLGHCLFKNTPESVDERQPIGNLSGTIMLTADARIDNRSEILSAIGFEGQPARSVSDAELILNAYQHWGEACPEKLVGDFAFAVWDGIHQKLFCARDPMGIKPLYYFSGKHLFVFGSEIQAFLCLSGVPKKLNELRIADHLILNREDQHSTFYQDIYQLPAGHCLTATVRGTQVRSFWDLSLRKTLRLKSDREYAEAFTEVFTEAVSSRMRSISPVGALLSGGLDSSAIVAVARKLLQQAGLLPLTTYSAVFPDLVSTYPRIDESYWIDMVVAQGGIQSTKVDADRLNPLDALDISVDEPIPVPNLWLNWGCFKAANQAGVRTVLSGIDGDTAVSYGHGYLSELAVTFQWARLVREAKALAKQTKRPVRQVFKEYGWSYLAPPPVKRVWRILRGREKSPSPLPFDIPIRKAFARRTQLMDRAMASMEEEWRPWNTARHLHRQSLRSGIVLYMPELIDKIAAACGVEARMPFFDRRLLEFLVSLPTHQKLRLGWNRFVLRTAMEGYLPAEVQWRTSKGDLRPNIRRGLFENRRVLGDVLLKDQVLENYFDTSRLNAAFERFTAAPMVSTEADVFSILIAFTLAQFLRRSGLSA